MIQAKKSLLLLAVATFAGICSFSQNNPAANTAAKPDTTKKAPPTPPKPTVADKVKAVKNGGPIYCIPGYGKRKCADVCKEEPVG
jgi:hypothetical protein